MMTVWKFELKGHRGVKEKEMKEEEKMREKREYKN